MISGALLILGAGMGVTGAVTDQAGLVVAGFASLALSIAAKWVADRELNRLLEAVATQTRAEALVDTRAQRQVRPATVTVPGRRPGQRWGPPVSTRGAATRANDQNTTTRPRPVSS